MIDTSDGTEFEFNSTAGGMTAVVRFQVPASRTYEVRYGGRDLFEIYIRLSQTTASLVTLTHEVWEDVSLDNETDYFLEIEQVDAAKLGATVVVIRDG